MLIAAPAAGMGPRIDLFLEELRLRAWLDRDGNRERVEADPLVIHEFVALEAAAGGPLSGRIRWYPLAEAAGRSTGPELSTMQALAAVRLRDDLVPRQARERGDRRLHAELRLLERGATARRRL